MKNILPLQSGKIIKRNTMAKIIGITNQKGGVTKTTIAHTFAREIAKDKKVLLIDMDGQATLTELIDIKDYLGSEKYSEYMAKNSVSKIFNRELIEPIDITSIFADKYQSEVPIKLLHFIPSSGNEMVFLSEASSGGKDRLLKKYLDKIKENYDYIIIDSLPGVSTLFKNVLLASDSIVIPIQTKTNAIAGANQFLSVLDDVIGDYDKEFNNIFILPTVYNKQRRDDKETYAEIKTDYLDSFKSFTYLSKIPLTLLDAILERSVFSNAQSSRFFVQDWIYYYDSGKRDILLLIEKQCNTIIEKLKD